MLLKQEAGEENKSKLAMKSDERAAIAPAPPVPSSTATATAALEEQETMLRPDNSLSSIGNHNKLHEEDCNNNLNNMSNRK